MEKIQNHAKVYLSIAGLFLFGWTIHSVGIEKLRVLGPALKGPGLLVMAIYPFVCFWDVWGWRVLFSRKWKSGVNFLELYAIRLAGEALNNITPFVDIGGEFLKVTLASKRFSLEKRKTLITVVMARTALFFSEIFFWIAGLSLIFFLFPVPRRWFFIFTGTIVGFLVLSAFISYFQKQGLFGTFIRWLEHLRINPEVFDKFQVSLKEVDEEIAAFHSKKTVKFSKTIFLHFLGWVAGGVETYFMFRVVGMPINLLEGIMLEAILQLVRSGSFFIPGNLGAQEAGLALAVEWMGFHPSLGVAVSLLKRLRQFIWTAIGFGIWGVYEWFANLPQNPSHSKTSRSS